MKYIKDRSLIFVFILIAPLNSSAQGPNASQPGLSGRFQAGFFYLQTDSQLSTDDSNRQNSDREEPADRHDMASALASIYLRYQFESGTAVYAGNPLELGEGLALSAGVIQPMGSSTLDVAVNWLPISEVWKDPYDTTRERDTSDVDTFGMSVSLKNVGGTPFDIQYRVDRFGIEDDDIGDLEPDLKRDRLLHELGFQYTLRLRRWIEIRPELGYSYNDSDGDANSYHGMKLGALLSVSRPPWIFMGMMSASRNEYRKTHPLFGKIRQESDYVGFAQMMRLNLFGSKRLFGNLVAGYKWTDANIDFYDSRTFFGMAGMGVNF